MAIPMQGNDEFTAGCKYRTGEMPAVRIEQVEAGLGTDPKAAMLRFGKGENAVVDQAFRIIVLMSPTAEFPGGAIQLVQAAADGVDPQAAAAVLENAADAVA